MTKITYEDAVAKVRALLDVHESDVGLPLCLLADCTIKMNEGWLFFYNSQRYVRTGDFRHALAGNGPIFVDVNGGTAWFPSWMPTEEVLVEIKLRAMWD